MKECTCFKTHIYGRCEVCKEWRTYTSEMFFEVKALIQKYPVEVKELLEYKNG